MQRRIRRRVTQLQREVANLTDAVAAGALRASPAIAAKLQATEAELAKLQAVKPPPKVSTLPAGIESKWRAAVANLETVLTAREPARGRAALMDVLGEILVVTTPKEIRFETQKGAIEGAFLRAAGQQQTFVVAGAGLRNSQCACGWPETRLESAARSRRMSDSATAW